MEVVGYVVASRVGRGVLKVNDDVLRATSVSRVQQRNVGVSPLGGALAFRQVNLDPLSRCCHTACRCLDTTS